LGATLEPSTDELKACASSCLEQVYARLFSPLEHFLDKLKSEHDFKLYGNILCPQERIDYIAPHLVRPFAQFGF